MKRDSPPLKAGCKTARLIDKTSPSITTHQIDRRDDRRDDDEKMRCSSGPFTLVLNRGEMDLFKLLLEFMKSTGIGTVLRANGGWVRDKLLNIQSSDLDIALDNMTGVEFASRLNKYVKCYDKLDEFLFMKHLYIFQLLFPSSFVCLCTVISVVK